LYNVLLVNVGTIEEANTKHVGIFGELAILHEWKNNLPTPTNYTSKQPSTYEKPEAASAVLGS